MRYEVPPKAYEYWLTFEGDDANRPPEAWLCQKCIEQSCMDR
jgi:hypothetical protein